MPRHTDRRTVLQTTGGLLVGAPILTGSGAAQEDGLRVNILRETLVPGETGQIPVEAMFPDDVFDELFPDDIFLGHRNQFALNEDPENVVQDPDGVANPVTVADFGNPHDDQHQFMMYFRMPDIDFEGASIEDGRLEMVFVALGDGGAASGTDEVLFAPDGVNGPVG